MTEMCKSLHNMNPSIVSAFHETKCVKYDPRKNKSLSNLLMAKTTSYGIDSESFRGSFLLIILDDNIKQEPTLAHCVKNIMLGM